MTKITIILPAYNEEKRILPTLQSVTAWLDRNVDEWEVLVIDDGSGDETLRAVSAFAAEHPKVIPHALPENRGKGAAVREGVLLASGEVILMMDADGAIPIEELPRLKPYLDKGFSVVIGSKSFARSGSGRHFKWRRLLMGRIFNFFVRFLLVPGVRDSQCGFKLFRRETAKRLFRHQKMNGYSFDMEILYLSRMMEIPFKEVQVRWRDIGGSRIHLIKDSCRMFLDIFRIRGLHRSIDYAREPRGETGKP